MRDYIHILDLANAHLKALIHLKSNKGINVFNLGTGRGFSVLELINTFEGVTGNNIPRRFIKKREGDVSSCYANPSKSKNILDWQTNLDLKEMCLSAWNFSEKKRISYFFDKIKFAYSKNLISNANNSLKGYL